MCIRDSCKGIAGSTAAPGGFIVTVGDGTWLVNGGNVSIWMANHSPTNPHVVTESECLHAMNLISCECRKNTLGGNYHDLASDLLWQYTVNAATQPYPASGDGGAQSCTKAKAELIARDANLVCANSDAPTIAGRYVSDAIRQFCDIADGKNVQPGLYPLATTYWYNNKNVSLSINNNGPTGYKVKRGDCTSAMNYILDQCTAANTGGIWYQEELDVYWLLDVNHASTPFPGMTNSIAVTESSVLPAKREAHEDSDRTPPHDIPLDGLHSFVSCYKGDYATIDDGLVSNAIYNFCQTYAGSTPVPGTLGIVDVKHVGGGDNIIELVCQRGHPDSTYALNPPNCAAALGHIYNSCPSKLGGVYYSSDPMYDVFYSLEINQPTSRNMHSTIPNPPTAPSPLPTHSNFMSDDFADAIKRDLSSITSSNESAAVTMRDLVSSDAVRLARRGLSPRSEPGSLMCYNWGFGADRHDVGEAILKYCHDCDQTLIPPAGQVMQEYKLGGVSAGKTVIIGIDLVTKANPYHVFNDLCRLNFDHIIDSCDPHTTTAKTGGICSMSSGGNFILDINPGSQNQKREAVPDAATSTDAEFVRRDSIAQIACNTGTTASHSEITGAISQYCGANNGVHLSQGQQLNLAYPLSGGAKVVFGLAVNDKAGYTIKTAWCINDFTVIVNNCSPKYTDSAAGDIYAAAENCVRNMSDIIPASTKLARRDSGDQISCDHTHTAPRIDVDTAMSQYCRLNAGVRLAQGQQANQAFSLPGGGKVILGTATTDQYGYQIETDWCSYDYTNLLNHCSDVKSGRATGGINAFGSDGVRLMVDIPPPSEKLARREEQSTGLECTPNQSGYGENKTVIANQYYDFCHTSDGVVLAPGKNTLAPYRFALDHSVDIGV